MANGNHAVEPRWRFGGIVASSLRGDLRGALSGRVVFLNAGHGWTRKPDGSWFLQRSVTYDVLEDHGNVDMLRHAADHCLNLGALVVPFRAVGRQRHLVVVKADSDSDAARATFEGDWRLAATRFFYSGRQGEPACRVAEFDALNDSARFSFRVPESGLYPVYVWGARADGDADFPRTEQLYVVHHDGGETERRVDHRLVGCGWIYLGSYSFAARGEVEIKPPEVGDPGFVVADAVRVGNGTKDIGLAEPVSYDEMGARYWIETSLGLGIDQAAADELDSIVEIQGAGHEREVRISPSRMARHMMPAGNSTGGVLSKRHLYLSFHSNAGRGRGAEGILNLNDADTDHWHTENQERWAEIVGRRMNDDLVALTKNSGARHHGFSYAWQARESPVARFQTKRKDEIDDTGFKGRIDATIVETGFHDHPKDAALLADPKARDAMGRAAARAITQYFREFDPDGGIPEVRVPGRPWAPRLERTGSLQARLGWRPAPVDEAAGGEAAGFCVYRSADGRAFGLHTTTAGTAVDLDFEDGRAAFFRVAAFNEAGESMPGPVVGMRFAGSREPFLVVQGHGELVAENNPEQVVSTSATGPLPTFVYRIDPGENNSLDHVADVGRAGDFAFESCRASAVESGEVELSNYRAVIWCAGREGRRRSVLSAGAVARLDAYCRGGGRLLIHGARIATGLQYLGSAGDAGRVFAQEVLGAGLDRTHFVIEPALVEAGGPLGEGLNEDLVLRFGTSRGAPYSLWNHDSLVVFPPAEPAIRISNSDSVVGTVHRVGEGRVVYLAFPFEALETADSEAVRRALLAACLRTLGLS